jgi:hypothetical protein
MAADRNQLRATFDSAADMYQESRPDYPDSLYDDWGTVLQVARRRGHPPSPA